MGSASDKNKIIRTRRRKGSAVTIEDVAREAGVSAMTVSRVINGESVVRDQTRALVQQAIEKLNYKPNNAARSLAAGGATQVGLLYANPSAAYLGQFLIGALEGARHGGSHLTVESCDQEGAEAQGEAARLFARSNIEGILLPPPLCEAPAVLAAIEAADIQMVTVAMGRPQPGGINVRIDDFAAARAMTRYLLEKGHRRIGFVRGHPNQTASEERWRGFKAALEEAGLDAANAPVEQGYFSYRSGIVAAERLLSGADRPTAIFASNDEMAAATVNVAHRHGLSVPADLSVVGFDDTPLATMVWPELTTIRQPVAAMAERALELLIAAVRTARDGGTPVPVEEVLDFELVERKSVAPPPKG
ncbi:MULTISPECIES: LacI family DNA-binding transcriptional regulator [unclassified Azospirillum]|uniref:LacI family DNA-binding transcriptional regulator n=1 Tax=unclassified Azospirillum TaxID=2630922 RepID=UPI000B6EB27E|nr:MULTISPECIES: LacI family DNA-binding transcriptional regulator [unclassified Azospirillum]SNS72302.1 transcriptional regulator, LacI family [Azospirillum sp. RU38E]SNS90197.1 transcriptional regulator, LacI family [Azospirillum sp. RU37A]